MREEHQDIGKRIAALREQQGWSQRALAKVMGLDQSALSRIEAGHRRVTAAELQRLARELHVSANELLLPGAPEDDPSAVEPPAAMFLDSDALSDFPARSAGISESMPDESAGSRERLDRPPREHRMMRVPSSAMTRHFSTSEESSPPMGQEAARPRAARLASAVQPLPGFIALKLPDSVVKVIVDWFKLRAVSARSDLVLPFSHGSSAQGKPASWAPHFPTPATPDAGEVLYDRLARFWRNELHVEADGPLPDLVTLLEDTLGVQIIVARVPVAQGEARAPHPDDESTSSETPFCASLLLDGVPFLFVNAARPVLLQRYALAHAFAHLALRHGDMVDEHIEWTRSNPREAAANDFAEEFLAPVRAVARWYDRRGEQTPTVETLLDLGNAFGISAWAALYRSRAVGRARAKTFSALRAELQAAEWQLLARQAFLGGLRDTLSSITPGEVHDPGAFGPPAVLRVPALMRRWNLAALRSGRLSLEDVAGCLHVDPAALAADLERLGLD